MARQPEPVQRSRTLLTGPGSKSQIPFALRLGHLPAQELADVGAGDDDALVDIESMALNPSLVGEVGGWLARGDALVDDFPHCPTLRHQEAGIEPGIELIDRQMKSVQNEISGLVERITSTVAIGETGRTEMADRVAQPIPHCG